MKIRISIVLSIVTALLVVVVAAGPTVFAQFDEPAAPADPFEDASTSSAQFDDPFSNGEDEYVDEDADPFANLLEAPATQPAAERENDPFGGSSLDELSGRQQAPRRRGRVNPWGVPETLASTADPTSAARMRIRQHARVVVEQVSEPVSEEELAKANAIRSLKTRIKKEPKEDVREKLAVELRGLLEDVFDADLEQRDTELSKLEERLTKLRAALTKRQAARERIINVQIESLLLESAGLAFPDVGATPQAPSAFSTSAASLREPEVQSVKDMPDGSRAVIFSYTTLSAEQRQRDTPYVVMVVQTRTNIENGKEVSRTIKVPEKRTRTEVYTVMVPTRTVDRVIVPAGRDVAAYLREYAAKHSPRRFEGGDYKLPMTTAY